MANKLSSRKLSVNLGKSTEYINQLENGRLNPSLEFVHEFCEFFNITLTEFFDADNAYPTRFKEIRRDLSRLNDEEVRQISEIIRSIAKYKR